MIASSKPCYFWFQNPISFFHIICLAIVLASYDAMALEEADYRLNDLDGVEHRISNLRGKWVVINFWATWCAPCLKEMPELQAFYQNNRARAEVWGVTFEDTDILNIRKFVAQLGVTYPILGFGQDPKTGYGAVKVLPTTFIIDQEGKFFHRFEGPITENDIFEIIGLAPN